MTTNTSEQVRHARYEAGGGLTLLPVRMALDIWGLEGEHAWIIAGELGVRWAWPGRRFRAEKFRILLSVPKRVAGLLPGKLRPRRPEKPPQPEKPFWINSLAMSSRRISEVPAPIS